MEGYSSSIGLEHYYNDANMSAENVTSSNQSSNEVTESLVIIYIIIGNGATSISVLFG